MRWATRSAPTSIPAISCGWAPIRSPPPRALGDAIYYVHAKDTRIDPVNAGINGVIDTTPGSDYKARAWSYITLGLGHDELWWHKFVAALAAAGYDGVLSIEHEDPAMSAEEGVEKSVELLRRVIVNRRARTDRRHA